MIPKASLAFDRACDRVGLVVERGIDRVTMESVPQQAPLGGIEVLVERLLQFCRQLAALGELVEDAVQNWGWVVDSDYVVEGASRAEVDAACVGDVGPRDGSRPTGVIRPPVGCMMCSR